MTRLEQLEWQKRLLAEVAEGEAEIVRLAFLRLLKTALAHEKQEA